MKNTRIKTLALILLLALLSLTALTSCSLGVEKPEKVVSNALEALKKQDKEKMEEYFTYEELMNFSNEETEDAEDNFNNEQIKKLIFAKLEYKIISSIEKGDKATVQIEITNIDMKVVMQQYFTEALQIAMSNAFAGDSAISDEELDKKLEQIFIDKMSKNDQTTKTTTVEIQLEKKDNKWKIQLDEKIQDAITGGMLTAFQDIED
jgi:hypothetical protein